MEIVICSSIFLGLFHLVHYIYFRDYFRRRENNDEE